MRRKENFVDAPPDKKYSTLRLCSDAVFLSQFKFKISLETDEKTVYLHKKLYLYAFLTFMAFELG